MVELLAAVVALSLVAGKACKAIHRPGVGF